MERAVERVRRFVEEVVGRGRMFYVLFSGGRDSAAALAAAMEATGGEGLVAVYLSIAGQTHVDNVRAVLATARRLGLYIENVGVTRRGMFGYQVMRAVERRGTPVLVVATSVSHRLGVDFWSAVRRYGWPAQSRGKRWCCADFKSDWFAELQATFMHMGRPARAVIAGYRAEESVWRRRLWSREHWEHPELPMRIFASKRGVVDVVLAPLADYTAREVDRMLREYGLVEVLEQYERWTRAPTCMLCPVAGGASLQAMVRNVPREVLERVLRILEELEGRTREGTVTRRRIAEWIRVIREALAEETV